MPTLDEIVAYCDRRTRRSAFRDFPGAGNGLQVANNGRVTRVGAAVDAGLAPFEQAAAAGVDFLVVHHGLFWAPARPVTGPAYRKLSVLLNANCALYSSHLPLDAHREIGNNALLARQLGLNPGRWFLEHEGEPIGCIAPSRRRRSELRRRLAALYPRMIAVEFGSAAPREVAFCSGSGRDAVRELEPAGVDTLVTGELREECFNFAQEHRLNLYACGHYATETHGVKALAAELAKKFKLPWDFIATSNPF
jgi:dinuclear metal center YbgI/SA1388 family protein